MVNFDSISCPRCGVVFREYRVKRVLFWLCLLALAGWAFHNYVAKFVPLTRHLLGH
jgi:hypothetical protein